MAGELWRGTLQIGKQTDADIAVPATRILYPRDPKLMRDRPPRYHKYPVRRRDNTRAVTNGPVTAGGSYAFEMSADEILETFLIGLAGGVTPTGNLWEFTPGPADADLDYATLEWHDGARSWIGTGYRANQIRINGSVSGENLVTVDLFGNDVEIGDLTDGLDEREIRIHEGWETQFFCDDFGGTPGSTAVPLVLINWDVTIGNALGRKYTANNVNAQTSTTSGELSVEAKLLVEASEDWVADEFANWSTTPTTKRLIRLLFGTNEVIGGGPDTYSVALDMPGAWGAFDLTQSDAGTRAYSLTYSYVFDPTNAFAFRAQVMTDRTTPYV